MTPEQLAHLFTHAGISVDEATLESLSTAIKQWLHWEPIFDKTFEDDLWTPELDAIQEKLDAALTVLAEYVNADAIRQQRLALYHQLKERIPALPTIELDSLFS